MKLPAVVSVLLLLTISKITWSTHIGPYPSGFYYNQDPFVGFNSELQFGPYSGGQLGNGNGLRNHFLNSIGRQPEVRPIYLGNENSTEPCLNGTTANFTQSGYIPQQNVHPQVPINWQANSGFYARPPYAKPSYYHLNYLPPALSSTFQYQFIPQVQLVPAHPSANLHHLPLRPLPTAAPLKFPTFKPFTFPTFKPFTLPTFKPFKFPTLAPFKPLTFPPMRLLSIRLPTLPPMRLPVIKPPRYTYVTFPPMRILALPTPAPIRFAELRLPTLPPLRLPVIEPIKFNPVALPTLRPFLIPKVEPAVVPEPIQPRLAEVALEEVMSFEEFKENFFGKKQYLNSALGVPKSDTKGYKCRCKNKTRNASSPLQRSVVLEEAVIQTTTSLVDISENATAPETLEYSKTTIPGWDLSEVLLTDNVVEIDGDFKGTTGSPVKSWDTELSSTEFPFITETELSPEVASAPVSTHLSSEDSLTPENLDER